MKDLNNLLKILTLILFPFASIFGQGWERVYESEGPGERVIDLLQTADNGFLMAGTQRENNQALIPTIIKTNDEGDLMWIKRFTGSNANGIDETDLGEYFVTGETGGFNSQIFVSKIGSDGNDQWTENLDYYDNLKGISIKALPNDESMVFGHRVDTAGVHNVFMAKLNVEGDTIWTKMLNDTINSNRVNDVLRFSDNSFLVYGTTEPINTTNNKDVFFLKVDEAGEIIWEDTYNPSFGIGFSSITFDVLKDDSFMGIVSGPRIVRFNSMGNLVSETLINLPSEFPSPTSFGDFEVILTTDSSFAFSAHSFDFVYFLNMNFDGLINWYQIYGNEIDEEDVFEIINTNDKGFALAGRKITNVLNNPQGGDFYLIKTDYLGNSWTNEINGKVFFDTLVNCEYDSVDLNLEGWIVSAETDSTIFYGVSDASGNYSIRLDTGNYNVKLHIPNAYWTPCWNDSVVSMPMYFDTINVDFPVAAQYECPIINVDISTPFLRRCFPNVYYVNYCNEGTLPADSAYIEVEFDEWLTIDSSSLDWTSMEGQIYIFDIGHIGIGECGGFLIYTTLDCDSTVLGQTHCVTAHSYPDSICLPPNTSWDGSTISVSGECLGDSILFKIENIGINPMSQLKDFIIIEDVVIHLNGTFQLGVDEVLEIPVSIDTAHTYRLEADQSNFHPTSTAPSVTIEGCGVENPLSLGFVNQYSQDDADPFVSIDCQENIGSYDPNDKRGFPKGIGEEHFIVDDTELEYHIRFQNTGTDTAFLVVIRDTLSSFLDPITIRPGSSSHPYTWTLQNNGALKFTFENIMLPDSNINELASHGFVKFKIAQKEGNLPGTIIPNRASIYFDFNSPILTNQTIHKIREPQELVDTFSTYYCDTIFYNQDTVIVTESTQLSWDVMTTNFIFISSSYETTIDSFIYIPPNTNTGDTTLTQYLTSTEGCDSIVIININFLVNNKNLENPISDIRLFPNPTSNYVNVLLNITQEEEFTFSLINNLGQTVGNRKIKQMMIQGENVIQLDLGTIANGVYYLKIEGKNNKHTLKVVVNHE